MKHINLTQYQRDRLKRKTEAEVQREIKQYLRATNRPYTVTDATKALNVRGQQVQRVVEGWPDLTTITTGARMFTIEVKRPVRGVLSREQALRLRNLHKAGVLICIARSVADVQEAEALQTARQCDLDEIEKAIAKPVKTGLETKPVNEFGF